MIGKLKVERKSSDLGSGKRDLVWLQMINLYISIGALKYCGNDPLETVF